MFETRIKPFKARLRSLYYEGVQGTNLKLSSLKKLIDKSYQKVEGEI